MTETLPPGIKTDERAERAKAEAIFADKLFKILLAAQDDGVYNRHDPVTPGELNRKWQRLYDEIWNAAFYVVTAKKRKKAEVS